MALTPIIAVGGTAMAGDEGSVPIVTSCQNVQDPKKSVVVAVTKPFCPS